MEYTIIIEKNKNGWLTGQCEQLPEAISEGRDIEHLMENMKDVIELILEYKRDEFRKQNGFSTNIMPLTLKHEKRRINKTLKRERVFA